MTHLTPSPNGHAIKLVRDKTASIINTSGEPGKLWYAPVSDEIMFKFLKKKLGEEVAEYLVEPGADELADIIAVVFGLGVFHNVGHGDLLRMANDDPRGGFFDGIMMFGHHAEFDGK